MTSHSTWWKSAMTVAVLGALFVFDWPAKSAPPPPLPAGMQKDVDRAIDAGVEFLKQTQGPFGTWTAMGQHQVGYAALPGLTLLECGMKPSDLLVQKAAAFVRWSSGTLDRT